MEEVEAISIIWEERGEQEEKDVLMDMVVNMSTEEEEMTTGIIAIKITVKGLTSQTSQGTLLPRKHRY